MGRGEGEAVSVNRGRQHENEPIEVSPGRGLLSLRPPAASILDIKRGDVIEVTRNGEASRVRVTDVEHPGGNLHAVTLHTEPATG
jgi:anaerobic selenocysteine-containing dehydrogenase